jgi:nitroreductase
MTRLSPSASNKQPWRIVKDGNNFHFYLSHTKGYSKAMGFDMQRIDIGIAMCHFELTAKELGLNGKWMNVAPSIKSQDENTEYIISWIK